MNRITPSTLYAFVLNANDSGGANAVTWLTASVGFEHSLDCRDERVEAQDVVDEYQSICLCLRLRLM